MWPLGKKLSNCLVIFAVLGVALALFFFFREGEEKLFLVEEEGGQPLSVVVASSPIWTYTGEKDGWVTYIYVRDPNRPNGHPCKRVGFVVIEKDVVP